jgi:uncharacterized protein YjiS (DUF1127 family)
MTAYSTNRATASVGVISIMMNLVGAVSDWNDARVTRKALGKLTDRELDDIGLCRGDIDEIAVAR